MSELVTKYPFLCEIKSNGKEHTEVTEEAIKYMKEHYSLFSAYEIVNRNHTNQITTPGWALSRGEKNLNVVGDVFINPKAFDSAVNTKLLERVYHTIGNFVPIAEGANYGGNAGKNENYQYKLTKIKNYFDCESDFISKDEIENIEGRLDKKISLGNVQINILADYEMKPFKNSLQLRYWIFKEWIEKGKNWESFIEDLILQDFVDDKLDPLVFNSDSIKDSVKLIIKRGYRIHHHNMELADDKTTICIMNCLENECNIKVNNI